MIDRSFDILGYEKNKESKINYNIRGLIFFFLLKVILTCFSLYFHNSFVKKD